MHLCMINLSASPKVKTVESSSGPKSLHCKGVKAKDKGFLSMSLFRKANSKLMRMYPKVMLKVRA